MTLYWTDKIAETAADARADMEAIRNNPRLSADGRAEQIAQRYTSAIDQIAAYRAKDAAEEAQRTQDSRRRLFGSSSAQSARDAADRAEQLAGPAELTAAMRKAQDRGDDVLVAELAREALNRLQSSDLQASGDLYWEPLRQFLQGRPAEDGEALAKLAVRTNRSASLRSDFARGMADASLLPSELAGLDRARIDRVAAGELGHRGMPIGTAPADQPTTFGRPASTVVADARARNVALNSPTLAKSVADALGVR